MPNDTGKESSAKSQNRRKAHDKLLYAILVALSQRGVFAWEHKTGCGSINGHFIRYGFIGSPDIVGIAPDGKFLGIEVKTGEATQTEAQRRFEYAVRKRGGHYIVARSVQDALTFLA